jgi:hypothetical protein
MPKYFSDNGTSIAQGFWAQGPYPLDDRFLVDTAENLASKLTEESTLATLYDGSGPVFLQEGDSIYKRGWYYLSRTNNDNNWIHIYDKPEVDELFRSLGVVYKAMGDITVSELNNLSGLTEKKGNVYNMSNSGTITSSKCVSGFDGKVLEGDQILINNDGKFDKLHGINTELYQTKLVGDNEIKGWFPGGTSSEDKSVENAIKLAYNKYGEPSTANTVLTYTSTGYSWESPTTYQVFTRNSNGLVPAPNEADDNKFLNEKGNWVTVNTSDCVKSISVNSETAATPDSNGKVNLTINTFNGATSGLVPADNISEYSSGYFLTKRGDWRRVVIENGTSQVDSDGNIKLTPNTFNGSFNPGLVPGAPSTNKAGKFLNGNGSWAEVDTSNCVKSISVNSETAVNPDSNGNVNLSVESIGSVSNNISKKVSNSKVYLSGPDIKIASIGQENWKESSASAFFRETIAESGNVPEHYKYTLNYCDCNLVNLGQQNNFPNKLEEDNYTTFDNLSSLSWRMRQGVAKMYNWGKNNVTFTGKNDDGTLDDTAFRFHRAWLNGAYGNYDINYSNNTAISGITEGVANRIIYTSNLSSGTWDIKMPTSEEKSKYPLPSGEDGKDSNTGPDSMWNVGIVHDNSSGDYKTIGNDGKFYTLDSVKTIESTITKGNLNFIFFSEALPTDITIMIGQVTGKFKIEDLTDSEIRTSGTSTYLYPKNKVYIEWSKENYGKDIEFYFIIKPTYYFSTLNRWVYSSYSVELYGKLLDSSNYDELTVKGSVTLSKAPSVFLTNYSNLPQIPKYTFPTSNYSLTSDHILYNNINRKDEQGEITYNLVSAGNAGISGSYKVISESNTGTYKTVTEERTIYLYKEQGNNSHINDNNASPIVNETAYYVCYITETKETSTEISTGNSTIHYYYGGYGYKISNGVSSAKIIPTDTSSYTNTYNSILVSGDSATTYSRILDLSKNNNWTYPRYALSIKVENLEKFEETDDRYEFRNLSTNDSGLSIDYHNINFKKLSTGSGIWGQNNWSDSNNNAYFDGSGNWVKLCRTYANNQGISRTHFRIVTQESSGSGNNSNICCFSGEYELVTALNKKSSIVETEGYLSYSWVCKSFNKQTVPYDTTFTEEDIICVCNKNPKEDNFRSKGGIYYDIYFNSNGKTYGAITTEELIRQNTYVDSNAPCSIWTYWFSNRCRDKNGRPDNRPSGDYDVNYKQPNETDFVFTGYNYPNNPKRSDWESHDQITVDGELVTQPNREFMAKRVKISSSSGGSDIGNLRNKNLGYTVYVGNTAMYFMPLTAKPVNTDSTVSLKATLNDNTEVTYVIYVK